jgi:serine/threonine-protein kinase
VYSLGCVLYEILTGEPPFVGDSPVAVAYQHVREDPVPPSQRHDGIAPELDAVVLKALAKNPDNRYQSAAEMRTDLVRVHSGEAPEAPKVLTDAERTSFLSAPTSEHRTDRIDQVGRTEHRFEEKDERSGSVGRWLIAVAVLAVLTVVVTVAINMFGGSTRDVQVPDVTGKTKDDAVAILQNAGFKTRDQQQSDSTIPPNKVIGTDPAAGTSVGAGDEVLIKVSSGPEQREVVAFRIPIASRSSPRPVSESSRPKRPSRLPSRRTGCLPPSLRRIKPRQSRTRSPSWLARGREVVRFPTCRARRRPRRSRCWQRPVS